MAFDLDGAIKAGGDYEGAARFLAEQYGYDYEGAIKAGGTAEGVARFLSTYEPEAKKAEPARTPKEKSALDEATDFITSGAPVRAIIDGVKGALFPEKKRSVMDGHEGGPSPSKAIEMRGGPFDADYVEGVRRKLETMPDESRARLQSKAEAGNQAVAKVISAQRRNIAANNAAPEPIRRSIGDAETRASGLMAQDNAPATIDDARSMVIGDVLSGAPTGSARGAKQEYRPELSDRLAWQLQDLGQSTREIPAAVLQGIGDIAQLVSGGHIGGDLSAAMRDAKSEIDSEKSMESQLKAAEFQRIMRDSVDPSAGLNFLLDNPGFAAQIAIPSVGSMALPLGSAAAAGRVAKALKYLDDLGDAARAKKLDDIRTAAVNVTAAAQNAGDSFTSTDGSLGDKYIAATIAGLGTYAVGKATGGGVEGALVRKAGDGRLGAVARYGIPTLKEGAQETGEGFSQSVGEQIGETGAANPRKALNQGLVEGVLGLGIGGGVTAARAALGDGQDGTIFESDQTRSAGLTPLIVPDAAGRSSDPVQVPEPRTPVNLTDVARRDMEFDQAVDARGQAAANPDRDAAVSDALSITEKRNSEPGESAMSAALKGVGVSLKLDPDSLTNPAVAEGDVQRVDPETGAAIGPFSNRESALIAIERAGLGGTHVAVPVDGGFVGRAVDPHMVAATGESKVASAPAETWTGRRGDGYATREDADRGLAGRQRERPDLDWSVEESSSGRFTVVGREKTSPASQNSAQAAETTSVASTPQPAPAAAPAASTTVSPSPDSPVTNNPNAAASDEELLSDAPAATPPPASSAPAKERILGVLRSSAPDLVPHVEEGSRNGRIVIGSQAEVEQALADNIGEPVEKVRASMAASEKKAGGAPAQGFYHGGKVYLIGDNISDDAVAGVVLHEATHGRQRAEIDSKVKALIDSRASPGHPPALRALLDRVAKRMEVEPEEKRQSEALPYLIEEAASAARIPGSSVLDGKAMAAIDKVSKRLGDLIREVVAKIRAWGLKRGMSLNPTVDDLVALGKMNLRDFAADGALDAAVDVQRSVKKPESDRSYKLEVDRNDRATGRGALSIAEATAIRRDAAAAGVDAEKFIKEARRIKALYPTSAGWAPLKVIGLNIPKKGADEETAGDTKITPKFETIAYGFNAPPGSSRAPAKIDEQWAQKLSARMALAIREIFARAESGDKNALTIVQHQSWYRNMVTILRREFGGAGDALADLLGATSPNTPVMTNWRFAIEILQRFSRGELDREMRVAEQWVLDGKNLRDLPGADRLRQVSGKLYGMNSTNSMIALLNLWRNIEPGSAPKARNFALNLIGQSQMATIDVWAARMLRRIANMADRGGFPRIPPVAEQGVTGNWNAQATKVTGEFGFGAHVMQMAVDELARHGITMTAPDLQAVAWFVEKELWTRENWTSKLGEGGSFEEEVEKSAPVRYTAGWTVAQYGDVPSNEKMSIAQARLMAVLRSDDTVLSARAMPTLGLYAGDSERSFDTELTVGPGFDPAPMLAEISAIAKENSQYDIFVSKVLADRDASPNARPGIEVYFKDEKSLAAAKPIMDEIVNGGVDGFTMVVDPRTQDSSAPGRTAGKFIGVRIQYIPEISMRWSDESDPLRVAARTGDQETLSRILDDQYEKMAGVVRALMQSDAVAHATVQWYDTVVAGKENYDEYTAGSKQADAGQAGGEVGFGRPLREILARADSRLRGDRGQDGDGGVRDGDGGQAGPSFSRAAPGGAAARPEQPAGGPGRGGDAGARAGAEDARGWSKRDPQPGSVSVDGWHYSNSKLPILSGSKSGTGIKGAEAGRLATSADPRIKRRVYFYIRRGDGSAPPRESGLGTHRHEQRLGNLYDPDRGDARVPRGLPANGFESAVLDAGYDGYINPAFGMAVVLNADVPVRYVGTETASAAPAEPAPQARLKKALMAREIPSAERIAEQIPGVRVRNGSIEVEPGMRDVVNEALAAADIGIQFSRRTKPAPKNTVVAYKLFRVDERQPGKLFPLFVNANDPVEVGKWLDADIGPAAAGGKVKSKLGPLAFRPGWHAGDLPVATHIGAKSSPDAKAPDRRPANHVWAEIEMAADRDWQAEADQRGTNAAGRIVPVKAHITDQIPVDGFYRYKTNPNMVGNWLISGSMKVNRVLTDDEVAAINSGAGVSDLPRETPFDARNFGFSRQRSPLGFYSALAEGVDSIKANAAPAAGWRDAIKGLVNKGLVKADEVEWSGVNDWLEMQQGKVTKDDVVEYLRGNGVQVEETVLGDIKDFSALDDEQLRKEYVRIRGAAPEAYGEAMSREEILDELENAVDEDLDDTKYGQYTLPGGTNYREVLLTLPRKVIEPDAEHNARVAEDRKAVFDFYAPQIADLDRRIDAARDAGQRGEYDRLWEQRGRLIEERDATAARRAGVIQEPRKEPVKYKPSHWDQPNVLAHLRVNDRTDVDGSRVLFVEELQSDWGQEGKKKGFASGDWEAPYKEWERDLRERARSFYIDAAENDEERSAAIRMGEKLAAREDLGSIATVMGEREQMAAAWAKAVALRDRVPAAPFVTKTEGWLNLALKRVLTMAVEGGYDKVAFVNGAQSADRYDLSKQIDAVEYMKKVGGQYYVGAVLKDGRLERINDFADESELEGLVGKEVAKKIVAGEGDNTDRQNVKRLSGLDLKVGGEGMKAFYDAIVPNAVRALAKRLGGQLVTVNLTADPNPALDAWEPEDGPGDGSRAPVERMAQPGLVITDEMRGKVSEGLPLFSRAQTDTPEFKRWFGNSKVVDKNGDPLVVYHGSVSIGVTVFDTTRVTKRTDAGDLPGTYFTGDLGAAGNYTTPKGAGRGAQRGSVTHAYLRIENPLNTTAAIKKYRKAGMSFGDAKRKALEALSPEHDGVIFDGSAANPSEYVVFRPEQIKSATGNNGQFDPANPDIRFSRASEAADRARAVIRKMSSAPKVSSRPAQAQDDRFFLAFISALRQMPAEELAKPIGVPIPIMPAPVVIQVAGLPRNPFVIYSSIVKKVWIEKHAAEMAGVAPGDVTRALRDPVAVVQSTRSDNEFYLISDIRGTDDAGRPGFVTFVIKAGAKIGPGSPDVNAIMSAYVRPFDGADGLRARVGRLSNVRYFEGGSGRVAGVEGAQFPIRLPALQTMPKRIPGWFDVVKFIADNYTGRDVDMPSFSRRAATPAISALVGGMSRELAKDPVAVAELRDAYIAKVAEDGHGRLVNPDEARDLNPLYNIDPSNLAAPTHEIASKVAKAAYAKFLASAGPRDRVLFVAGGGGSGKGAALAKMNVSDDAIIYDAVHGDIDGLTQKARQASDAGVKTEIVYVNTPAIIALRRAIGRAKKIGRTVPLSVLAEAHHGASNTIREAHRTRPFGMKVRVYDGLNGGWSTIDDVPVYDRAQLEQELNDELDTLEAAGEVSRELADAFRGSSAEGAVRADPDRRVGGSGGLRRSPGDGSDEGPGDPDRPDLDSPGQRGLNFSRTPPLGGVPVSGARFTLPAETKTQRARRKAQDSFLRMKVVQDAITGQGGTVTEKSNVYRNETLSYGRKQDLMDTYRKTLVKPLVEKAVRHGVTLDELALYAYAVHAPERNAAMQAKNPGLFSGSGMDDNAARAIIDEVRNGSKAAEFDELHRDLMKMTRLVRQRMFDYGLITADQFNALDSMYQNYVPLRGFGEVVDDVIEAVDGPQDQKRPFAGRKVDVRGKPIIRALGRDSLAASIIENVIGDYERVIAKGEDNIVARSLLKLVKDNPDPGLWEINATTMQRSLDANGIVQTQRVIDQGPDTIGVKVAGQQLFIKIKDPLLVRAVKATHRDDFSGSLAQLIHMTGIDAYAGWLRKTLTQWNPYFVYRNTARDFQTGLASVIDELGFEGANRFKNAYWRAYGSAFRAAMDIEANPNKPRKVQWDAIYREYARAGGVTGAFHVRELTDIRSDIDALLSLAGNSNASLASKLRSSALVRAPAHFVNLVDAIGSASENATRVAAYKVARDMGKSTAEAASIAKELTTNFNRKGEWGAALNGLYLFFNAGVQGSARTVKALANKKVWYTMAAVSGLAAGLAMWGADAGGEDDDGQKFWDKIPDYEKERNLIVMLPPGVDMVGAHKVGKLGRYIKIPAPYGFNVFTVLGYALADSGRHIGTNGREGLSVGRSAMRIASAAFGSFNPFGGSIDFAKPNEVALAALPTLADLPWQLYHEVNAWGRPVAPRQFDDTVPDSQRFSPRQAGGAAQKVADWAFRETAGREYLPTIDVTPGSIETLVNAAGGGLGQFVYDVAINVPTKLLGPGTSGLSASDRIDRMKARDIPFWRDMVGNIDATTDVMEASRLSAEAKSKAKVAKRMAEMGIKVDLDDPESKALLAMESAAKAYTKAATAEKKKEIALMTSDKSADEKYIERQAIELRQKELAQEFVTKWVKTKRGD